MPANKETEDQVNAAVPPEGDTVEPVSEADAPAPRRRKAESEPAPGSVQEGLEMIKARKAKQAPKPAEPKKPGTWDWQGEGPSPPVQTSEVLPKEGTWDWAGAPPAEPPVPNRPPEVPVHKMYTEGHWGSHINYECALCPYSTIEKDKILSHIVERHSGVASKFESDTHS